MVERLKRMILPDVTFEPAFKWFLCLFACFQGAMHFSSIFINLFLLQGADMTHICIYNGVVWAVQPFAYYLSGFLGKKSNMALQIRISMISMGAVYLILILLGERAAEYSVYLGLLCGIANGFYYLPHGYLINELNDRNTVDAGLNSLSLISSVEGIVIPLLAGGIISAVSGITGYLAVFSCSLALMMGAFLISFRLPGKRNNSPYRVKPVLKKYTKEKSWHLMLGVDVIRGFREGGLAFIISILMFLCVHNELFISFNSTVCSLANIAVFGIVIKRLNADNRLLYYRNFSLAIFLASCMLFINQGVIVLFLFSLLNSIGGTLMSNTSTAMEYDVLNNWSEIGKYRAETFAVRETVVDYSRVLMMLLLLFIEQRGLRNITVVAGYIAGICLLQFLLTFLLKHLQKEIAE